MALEKKIENEIKSYLRDDVGAYVIKYHGNQFSQVGVPDILACHMGHFYGIEVKQPGEEPTELQKYNIKRINETGGTAFVAESLEDVVVHFGGTREWKKRQK